MILLDAVNIDSAPFTTNQDFQRVGAAGKWTPRHLIVRTTDSLSFFGVNQIKGASLLLRSSLITTLLHADYYQKRGFQSLDKFHVLRNKYDLYANIVDEVDEDDQIIVLTSVQNQKL